jgi:hypothetical protein
VSSLDFSRPPIVRALGRFARWAVYHAVGAPEPVRPPARLTYHGSAGERAPAEIERRAGEERACVAALGAGRVDAGFRPIGRYETGRSDMR